MATEDRNFASVVRLLMSNADKNFVQRIIQKDAFPAIENEDGSVSTHRMAFGSISVENGKQKYIVYPEIVMMGDKLVDLKDKAQDFALKTGEYLTFDTEKDA